MNCGDMLICIECGNRFDEEESPHICFCSDTCKRIFTFRIWRETNIQKLEKKVKNTEKTNKNGDIKMTDYYHIDKIINNACRKSIYICDVMTTTQFPEIKKVMPNEIRFYKIYVKIPTLWDTINGCILFKIQNNRLYIISDIEPLDSTDRYQKSFDMACKILETYEKEHTGEWDGYYHSNLPRLSLIVPDSLDDKHMINMPITKVEETRLCPEPPKPYKPYELFIGEYCTLYDLLVNKIIRHDVGDEFPDKEDDETWIYKIKGKAIRLLASEKIPFEFVFQYKEEQPEYIGSLIEYDDEENKIIKTITDEFEETPLTLSNDVHSVLHFWHILCKAGLWTLSFTEIEITVLEPEAQPRRFPTFKEDKEIEK